MGVDGNVVAGDAADRDSAGRDSADRDLADDEAALSWSGETDPTHVAAPRKVTDAARAEESAIGESASAPTNPILLIAYGILAGVYLLYAIGWGFHAFTTSVPVFGIFPIIMYQFGEFLAIASPFLWALTVWVLVKKAHWRVLLLFVGVLVLAPWPFIVN